MLENIPVLQLFPIRELIMPKCHSIVFHVPIAYQFVIFSEDLCTFVEFDSVVVALAISCKIVYKLGELLLMLIHTMLIFLFIYY